MIKTKGYRSFDQKTGDFIYHPVKYLDFHCTVEEWKNLISCKNRFIYQLREKLFGKEEPYSYYDVIKKKQVVKQSYGGHLDRTGDNDKYSSSLIKKIIQEVTNIDVDVNFYSHEGNIHHIIINFIGHEDTMPNIVVEEDDYGGSSNKTYIDILNTIYKVLEYKSDLLKKDFCKGKTRCHNKLYYNSQYDFYNYTGNYTYHKNKDGRTTVPEFGFHKSDDRFLGECRIIQYRPLTALI